MTCIIVGIRLLLLDYIFQVENHSLVSVRGCFLLQEYCIRRIQHPNIVASKNQFSKSHLLQGSVHCYAYVFSCINPYMVLYVGRFEIKKCCFS